MARETDRHPESQAYLDIVEELPKLHEEKSSTYGKQDSPFENFRQVGLARGEDCLLYILDRIVEKAVRARNMIKSGQWDKNVEFKDMAGLSICGEAITRTRRDNVYRLEDVM